MNNVCLGDKKGFVKTFNSRSFEALRNVAKIPTE